MHTNSDRTRRTLRLASAAAAGIAVLGASRQAPAAMIPGGFSAGSAQSLTGAVALHEFTFAYDRILGTSMDLIVQAPRRADALNCELAVLCEIERLGAILSTYDPSSEISRVKAGATIESDELESLLASYKLWNQRTGGAINVNLAEIKALWKHAAGQNAMPSVDSIQTALDARLALNVDALGKGFIIDRAVEVARNYAPSGLLDIGGDIRAWGDANWLIGVADPQNPAENAPLLSQFVLRNSAVATSGGYARYFDIDGKRYSHIIDPRSGYPVAQVTSATIIADDCLTANAISTAASVMGLEDGSILANRFASGHLIVDDNARQVRDGTLALAADATPGSDNGPTSNPASSDHWPKDFQLAINVAIGLSGNSGGPAPRGGPPGRGGPGFGRGPGGKRPYVAVWIEDSKHKLIRTLSILGNDPKYTRELTYWWQAAGNNTRQAAAVTRATRPNGVYTLAWDGTDDKGNPLPTGKYTIVVELNREHGRHVRESVQIDCGNSPTSATINSTAESDESTVEYGPKKKS